MNTATNKDYTDLSQLPQPRTLTDVTSENFAEKVLSHYQPVVLKGLADNWPFVQLGKKSLSDAADYLQRHDRQKPLKLVDFPSETNGRMFYSDDLKGMNFTVKNATLTKSIERMLEFQRQHSYCVQCVPVNTHFPGLEDAFNNPLLPGIQPFIWIGNQVTVAPHFDEANNIAVVAAGRRRFTLFPPEQVRNLYIGPLDYTPAGQPISLVNLANPDLDKHPLYKEAFANALSVELEAGDGIYIPTPWWHHVESLSEFNVLVNYWWNSIPVSSGMPFPMLMHAIQAFKFMPQGQQQAWKAMLEHYVLNDSEPAAHIPDAAKGILGQPNQQVTSLIQKWLAAQLK